MFKRVQFKVDYLSPSIFHHFAIIQVVNPTFIFMVFEDNIIFSANEQIGGHSVTKYDELSVTVSWDVQVADAKFEVPIVRGMAHATALYEKLSPKVTIPNMVTVNDQNSGTVSGKRYYIQKFC